MTRRHGIEWRAAEMRISIDYSMGGSFNYFSRTLVTSRCCTEAKKGPVIILLLLSLHVGLVGHAAPCYDGTSDANGPGGCHSSW